MDDYILRASAIDAMEKTVCGDTWEVEQAINAVKGLPPVNVEFTEKEYKVLYLLFTIMDDFMRIAHVIDIDGVETNELFMVDLEEDGFFIWKSDWYEGGKKVVLIDFFPVSEAINSSVQPETCEGCKHLGKWDNEVECGYPSPCTNCKRRVGDHYER